MAPKLKDENLGITAPKPQRSNVFAHLGGQNTQESNNQTAERAEATGGDTGAGSAANAQTDQQLPSRIGAESGTGSATGGAGPFGGGVGLFQNIGNSQSGEFATQAAGSSGDARRPLFSALYDLSKPGPFSVPPANSSNMSSMFSKPPAWQSQSNTGSGTGNTGGPFASRGNQHTPLFSGAAYPQQQYPVMPPPQPAPSQFVGPHYVYPNYGTRVIPFIPIIRSCGIERSYSSGYLEPGQDVFYSLTFQMPYEDHCFEELRVVDYHQGSDSTVTVKDYHDNATRQDPPDDRFSTPYPGQPVHAEAQSFVRPAPSVQSGSQRFPAVQTEQQNRAAFEPQDADLKQQNAMLVSEIQRLHRFLREKEVGHKSAAHSQPFAKDSAGLPPLQRTPLSYNTPSSASSTHSAGRFPDDQNGTASNVSPALNTGADVPAVPEIPKAWMSGTQAMPRMKDSNANVGNTQMVQQHESQIQDLKTEIENLKVDVAGLKAQVKYLTGEKKDPQQQSGQSETSKPQESRIQSRDPYFPSSLLPNQGLAVAHRSRTPSVGEQSQADAGLRRGRSPSKCYICGEQGHVGDNCEVVSASRRAQYQAWRARTPTPDPSSRD